LEGAELEVFERALAVAVEAAAVAFRAQDGWVDGVRAGLLALLELFDRDPAVAQCLVVSSAYAGPVVRARRREVLERVAVLLDNERAPARAYPPLLSALAVANGVLGVLHAQLSEPEPGLLVELVGPLMSFTVMPFLGARAARRELQRPAETVASVAASVGVDLLQEPGRRLSHFREIEVLEAIAAEPGLSSTQVGLRAGVQDQGHLSRRLGRLARLGLIESTPAPGCRGMKAWRLTASGEQLHVEVCREAQTPIGAVSGLPQEFEDRVDFWGVCVLRAVGEQPWLAGSEIAARAGVDPAQVAKLLARLAGLGLVQSAREVHRRGTPRVWQITDSGRELDDTIERGAPAPARSVVLDLMWQSGGRLSESAISVLKASAAEPGLSNGAIAQRVGIADANSASQLLARLQRRGLMENARNGGRENVWVLTTNGRELESAIRREASAPALVSRTVAFDLLREQGGRLNHRVVSVLNAIGAEAGLNNTEVSERVGIESKGHASMLLARLARFGLIENQVLGGAPFEANAWRLTLTGRQLEAAIRHERESVAGRPLRSGQGTNPAAGHRRLNTSIKESM
jgi:DNA-binding MarR family transcriptional regulator